MSHPHILGDVGTIYRATIKDQDNVVVNVSAATTIEIIFKKPGGTLLTRTAVFTNNGSDGKIQYITIAGDIDEAGTWEWQPHVIISVGNEWKGDPVEFVVADVLKAA